MFLQCVFASLSFLVCFTVFQATTVLEKRIDDMFLEKYRLFYRPHIAMKTFCARESKTRLFDCPLKWYWHQDGLWQEVCNTAKSRWFFPPRYYQLVLQCQLGDVVLTKLRSEWLLFY